MWKMAIANGSTSCYLDTTVNSTGMHEFDGVEFDVGIYQIPTGMSVRKMSMNTGNYEWSNVFACVNPWTYKESYLIVSKDQSKVYTFIGYSKTTTNVFWTIFDYATGSVIGNRYLGGPKSDGVLSIVESNNYAYVLIKPTGYSIIAKYDKASDTFIDYLQSNGLLYNMLVVSTIEK